MKMIRVEIICIGTELLSDRVNTDVNLVARFLNSHGLFLARSTTVPDEQEEIAAALRNALAESDLVFLTGGLGPTFDDLTREACAECLHRELVFCPEVWHTIEERFRRRNVVLPEINRKQAYILTGSLVLENAVGTAPGLIMEEAGKFVILLPGPPAELVPMLEKQVLPFLQEKKLPREGGRVFRFGFAGLPESVVETRSSRILEKYRKKGELEFTILAQPVLIEIVARALSHSAEKAVAEMERDFQAEFGPDFLGVDPPGLPEILGRILKEKQLTLVLAESCTGGLAGKLVTDIPGSSEYFRGSIVAYSNLMKKKVLKVPRTLLRKYGAVSREVALAMALGSRKLGRADCALSITGIAGPTGATAEKPVGLVWIAAVLPDKKTLAWNFVFPGSRHQIRERAVLTGLDLLRREFSPPRCN